MKGMNRDLRIIWQEMKKIFRPIMLIMLILINLLMYYIFIDFDISYFANGRPAKDYYEISSEMIEDYGRKLDEKEYDDFKQAYQEALDRADAYIQKLDEAQQTDVASYAELVELNNKNDLSSPERQLYDKLLSEKEIGWEIQTREGIMEDMDSAGTDFGYGYISGKPSERQEARINDLLEDESFRSIFPAYPVGDNFHSISQNICLTILVSILFMILPITIRDYKNRMIDLQYTSRAGRKLFIKKAAAGVLSAFIIATVLLCVYYGLYFTNNITIFLNSDINSFLGYPYWYNLTFWQLILIVIGLTYILALSTALCAIFISSISKNYISVIGLQFPIFACICWLLTQRMLLGNALAIDHPQPQFFFTYGVIIILPAVAILWKKQREQQRDIL